MRSHRIPRPSGGRRRGARPCVRRVPRRRGTTCTDSPPRPGSSSPSPSTCGRSRGARSPRRSRRDQRRARRRGPPDRHVPSLGERTGPRGTRARPVGARRASSPSVATETRVFPRERERMHRCDGSASRAEASNEGRSIARRSARSPHTRWESTGLVARSVFKTAEAFARGLVGSIPTHSRRMAGPKAALRRKSGTPPTSEIV